MRVTFFFLAVTIFCACSKSGASNGGGGTKDTQTHPAADTPIFRGADISWVTQMEDSGFKFYNSAGTAMDCFQLMQSLGMNSIRLRVWVNPSNKYNSTADFVKKAVRAHNLGMRVLVDFHYSDTWADPGHQAKPAAWSAMNFATLTSTVTSYTKSVLDTLKTAGVIPSWVQIGNETDNGMLWPDGQASTNMANFAALIDAGYKAVKDVSDTIKVIVHISNGWNNSLFRWMFDGLTANGAQFDIIGMSLYPAYFSSPGNWQACNDSCAANMNDMVTRYHKPVMVVEVGMPANQPTASESFITDLMHKVKAVPGGNGLGVLYWEPESYAPFLSYGLGAFDNTGKPTVAMNAFSTN
ncbi:MAG TPA: glycosyl hydrolase 53 family protein [Puia sp.]|jgi:arabinogalactan endo-1,4-beta-galactosidase|nr:glycosyl hydrolase 53 family protein [Puia sp.]